MFDLHTVALGDLTVLRLQQAAQMHGPVQSYTDEAIAGPAAICFALSARGGYACFDADRTLVEIYVEPAHRHLSLPFLRAAVAETRAERWTVNSYDRFALSLAWNAGYSLTAISAYLWAWGGAVNGPVAQLERAQIADLPAMRPILTEDNFYTTDWDKLPRQFAEGLWHVLREPIGGQIIGIGYYEPIERTPGYADVGMVVTAAHRRQGHAAAILRAMCNICWKKGLEPVSVCDVNNEGSRRSLERAGFYSDGRIWDVAL